LFRVARVPPEFAFPRNFHVEPASPVPVFFSQFLKKADTRFQQPPRLVLQATRVAPFPAACIRVKANVAHERGQAMAELKTAGFRAHRRRGHPEQHQARNRPVWIANRFPRLQVVPLLNGEC